MSNTDLADKARDALLTSIAESAATTTTPAYLRNLAEAYALVVGNVTSVEHIEVKS